MTKSLTISVSFLVVFFIHNNSFAQWVQTNGPYGGNITALASNGTDLYAGTAGNGLYKSTNNGTSWNSLQDDSTMQFINTLAVKGDTLFLTSTSNFGLNNGAGDYYMYFSTDSGMHWTNLTSNAFATAASVPAIGDSILVVGNERIFLSSDNGVTWTDTKVSLGYASAIIINGRKIFVGSYIGVYVSLDNGKNWRNANIGLLGNGVVSLAINGNNVYAGTTNGIYVTTDDGVIWNSLGLTKYSVQSLIFNGNTMYAATDSGAFVTTDNGVHWVRSSNGFGNIIIYNFSAIGDKIFAASPAGIFETANTGKSWSVASEGITNIQAIAFALSGNKIFVATNGSGVFVSTDTGSSWKMINNGISDLQIHSLINRNGLLLASTNGNELFRSTDNGSSWINVDSAFQYYYINGISAIGNDVFMNSSYGLYSSTDDGMNWNVLSQQFYGLPLFIHDSVLFAKSNIGVYSSTDSGLTWTYSGLANANVTSMILYNGSIYAGTNAGVYYTSDNGANWFPTGLTAPYISAQINTLAAGGGHLFAGTQSNGVYYSSDNGATWFPSNAGLIDTVIETITVYGSNVFVGTQLHGVWERPINDFVTAVNENPSASPAQFSLAQNYPNPFGGMTNFEYGIPNEEHVALKVYNSLGEEVATLVNGQTAAGIHSATFNADNMQNGIYFYKLTAGKYAQTGKMAVVK
jgi:photosystem II stability/assembly factor-like uncharacterized protein